MELPEASERAPAGPIAIFDSGIGGLSVLRHVRTLLPHENLIYLADQAHVPYGPRPAAEVRAFTEGITNFFLGRGAKVVVVACNRATAAALNHLRARYPFLPFVGMEPAVKPAAAQTRSGKIGVLATAGTFESRRYESLIARFGREIEVFEDACAGLVPLIEAGELETPEIWKVVQGCVSPMIAAGVDTLVLGCTHYPFILHLIEEAADSAAGAKGSVTIIDPAPAVARQLRRVLDAHKLARPAAEGGGRVTTFTTGDPGHFSALTESVLGTPVPARRLRWTGGEITALD